jgi:hypothetical protein
VVGAGRLVLALAVTIAVLVQPACGGNDGTTEPESSLDALCGWLQRLSASSIALDVTADNVPDIGADAGRLVAEAGGLGVPAGEVHLRLNNTVEVLEFIEDAAGRDGATDTIPGYAGALADRLSLLLRAMRTTYRVPPDQAPCSEFDFPGER